MSLYSYSLLAGILMPGIPPGAPVGPGIVTNPNQYPQYGVGGGTPGQSGGWKIVVARNGAEKMTDINQGFTTWFSTRQAAQNFMSSESSQFGSGSPPVLSGLAAIGDFFARLTEANTWIRVGEFIAGGLILYVGLKALITPASQANQVGRRTVKQTARSIVEHTTPVGRAERAARKAAPRRKART